MTPENWSGRMRILSSINGNVANRGVERYRDLNGRHLEILAAEGVSDDTILMHVRTSQARLEVAQAARTRVESGRGEAAIERHTVSNAGWIGQELALDANEGVRVRIDKTLALHCSRDPGISEAGLAVRETAANCEGFDALLAAHRTAWHHLWDEFDVEIDTDDPDLHRKLRLHTFHLLQTLSLHSTEHDTGTPARGWHGEAYRGPHLLGRAVHLPVPGSAPAGRDPRPVAVPLSPPAQGA
ncbi:MAG: hypothetical protein U5K33_03310 [Halofilum sp. (in: g-proteobacteria)]|nr:hypothetical protein [Halofilum sp. (in: g-proteobacteria)]